MVNLIGADGKKPIKISEQNQLDAISGDSVARESGSVPQTFSRILSVKFTGDGFEFKMKPDKYDLRDTIYMSVYETFKKFGKMRQMLRKAPLVDPKMACEMLIELERKLIEACENNENALKEVQKAILDTEQLKKARLKEDQDNGIVRF